VIFCNTRRKVDWLTEKMHQRDFTVSAMHGDMDQKVKNNSNSLSWAVLRIRDVYPGSRILIFTHPGSKNR
jgi:hypothetical protein